MATDWQQALSGLRSSIPEGEEIPVKGEKAPEKSSYGKLNVFYEKKGRAGKPCTIITGFNDETQARETASRLKSRLGVGGSARGTEVLLQGDQREKLKNLL